MHKFVPPRYIYYLQVLIFTLVKHIAARSEDKCYRHVYREQMDIPPSLSQLSTSW